MPTVEVPGHGDVEFPDTMSDADIVTAIKRLSPAPVSTPMAALSGAAKGATFGFGNRAAAAWESMFPGGKPRAERVKDLNAQDNATEAQHPYAFGAGEIGSALLPAAVTAGGGSLPMLAKWALPLAAGQGMLQGAGYSNADSAKGMARDVSVGGGLGVLGYGLGSLLSKAGGAVSRLARGRAVRATAEATDKAAQEIAEQIASARGSLGGEVQKGNRIVENLRRIGTPLSASDQAAVDALEQRLSASNLQSLPGQAGAISARDAELSALQSGASQALKTRTAELLSPAEAKGQFLTRALRYGPVAAGSAAGALIGGPLGASIGALTGAGSRPAVQSLRRFAKNPAVVKAVADSVANAAEGRGLVGGTGTFLRRTLQYGGPAAATQVVGGQ